MDGKTVAKQALAPGVLVLWALAAEASWAGAGEATWRDQAQQILQASGVGAGLIVHLGCGDGRLTAALGRSSRYVVQGLEADEALVAEARRLIAEEGIYGRVSVRRMRGNRLPYVDNLVNLLICQRPLGVGRDEMRRVLAPRGVLLVRQGDRWERYVKPWPEEIDEWTHFLHGADNNAVARDERVGPPAHVQWVCEPIHLRSHEHLNSISALVSAGGRIFYIVDEGPTSAVLAPPRWTLVARDAFNGLLLWKRDLGPWEGHFRLFRSGPPEIARRLVAVGQRVFVTLGYNKPVAAFDAETGQMLRSYPETEGAVEIVCDGRHLFVVTGTIDPQAYAAALRRYYPAPPPRNKGVVAVDIASGQLLWRRQDADTAELMPTTLAVAGPRVFFQNTTHVICLDAHTGQQLWRAQRPVQTTRLSWSAPILVATEEVVLSADGPSGGLPADARRGEPKVRWIISDQDIRLHPPGEVIAFSAETGQRLWQATTNQGFCNPGDLFVIDQLVWAGGLVSPRQQTLNVARDLATGAVKWRLPEGEIPVGGHARCYRNKATRRFLVLGGTGVEFVDLHNGNCTANPWLRGTCQYGVMPCNGLLYVPPDSCACVPNVRLHGFAAMRAKEETGQSARPTNRSGQSILDRGPAYGSVASHGAEAPAGESHRPAGRGEGRGTNDDWPTYRHDMARSGVTPAGVGRHLKPLWSAELGGRLSSPVVADGRVFVARRDAHAVVALDVRSGKTVWRRTVGGPVDSPPTVAGGLVVFGCLDGWVYALRAMDGRLVWRLHAAPEERLLMAFERLQSAWPVHGSVLVRDGLVWFAAGRSCYLDGGLWLCAARLETGEVVVRRRLDGRNPQLWPSLTADRKRIVPNRLPGTRPDILSSAGELLFMGWTCFDLAGRPLPIQRPHLFSATGFLDDTWWHRTYWQYGSWMRGGFGGWPQAARQAPAGRLLVVAPRTIFGFGRSKYDPGNPQAVHAGHVGVIKDGYQDSGRVDHTQNPYRLFAAVRPDSQPSGARQRGIQYRWQTRLSILGRAMVLAADTLLVAGPNAGNRHEGLIALGRPQPGQLVSVAPEDGHVVASCSLPADPVLDGMAAVEGHVVLSCSDGTVRCLADR